MANQTTPSPDRYQPVPFDPVASAARLRAHDPQFRAAYDALEEEFAALADCRGRGQAQDLPLQELNDRTQIGISQR